MTTDRYRLSAGRHARPQQGRCAMEWVAHVAGEAHSDRPECVSLVVGAFARSFNDALDDETRQRLRPYLARMIGTAGDGGEELRAWRCADWLVRTGAPALLELARLDDAARGLRALTSIASDAAARAAAPHLEEVAELAAASRGDARAAARDESGEPGWTAALDATRAALRAAPPNPVRDPLTTVAWGVSWNAAWTAAWSAVPGSPSGRLAPTLRALRGSAFELLDALLPGELVEIPAPARRPAPVFA